MPAESEDRGSRRPPGDDEYAAFVQTAWPRLYRTAYLLLGDHGLAEDLVQTALAKTYASWSQVRHLDAATSYARTTMVNTASSWFRRRSWRRELPSATLTDRAVADADPSLRPSILEALGTLPPRQRAVIVLRYYDDLSVGQTAAVLRCAEGTVKSQTHDALARLRTLLGEHVITETIGTRHD